MLVCAARPPHTDVHSMQLKCLFESQLWLGEHIQAPVNICGCVNKTINTPQVGTRSLQALLIARDVIANPGALLVAAAVQPAERVGVHCAAGVQGSGTAGQQHRLTPATTNQCRTILMQPR